MTDAEFVEHIKLWIYGGPGTIEDKHRIFRLVSRGAEADEIDRLRAEVERLTAENASLASWQCEFTDGKTGLVYSEGGSTYCGMAKREATLRAEVEKLTGERDRQYDENVSLIVTNERLRAALKPFAKYAGDFHGLASTVPVSLVVEPHVVWLENAVTAGDFENARASLAEEKKDG